MDTRHQRAWKDAKPWVAPRRELVLLVLGGIVTVATLAAIGHLNDLTAAVIAVAGAVAAAILLPFSVYGRSFITAGSRTVREELVTLRDLIERRTQPLDLPAPSPAVISPKVELLRRQAQLGDLLLERCPKGSGITGGGTPTPLLKEVAGWIKESNAHLQDWPEYQAQFGGTVATESLLVAHGTTAELRARLNILRRVIGFLEARNA